jgi:hypothetical protein
MHRSLMLVVVVAALPLIVGCTPCKELERENALLKNQLQVSDRRRPEPSRTN